MATVAEEVSTDSRSADAGVGVLILTYNRVAEVCRTVERTLALREQPRIVVVDNGSTDGTPATLRARFPDVRCIALQGNPGCAGRNAGVAALDTPYVALCDDDTWWEPGSLQRAADLLDAYPHLAVLAARILVGPENRLDPTCREMAACAIQVDRPLPGPPVVGFLAGAAMVRRSAFLAVGGFEQRFFIGGEEEPVALDLLSAGWELAYVDDVVVHHHPSELSRDTSRRRTVVTRNHLWVTWMRYPWPWVLRSVARTVWAGRNDSAVRAGLRAALRDLPWALRRRRVMPTEVQRRLQQLSSA